MYVSVRPKAALKPSRYERSFGGAFDPMRTFDVRLLYQVEVESNQYRGIFLRLRGGQRMTTRRRVVIALGTAVLAPPLVSFAQQQPHSRARIGFLPLGSPSNSYDRSLVDAFRQGLREVGLI